MKRKKVETDEDQINKGDRVGRERRRGGGWWNKEDYDNSTTNLDLSLMEKLTMRRDQDE